MNAWFQEFVIEPHYELVDSVPVGAAVPPVPVEVGFRDLELCETLAHRIEAVFWRVGTQYVD